MDLALAIFHESTIVACKSYFPEQSDVSNFLTLVSVWWTIANSRKQYTPNALSNDITTNDGKLNFYNNFADWLQDWAKIYDFCLTKQ